jgi:hypothetical protein
MVLKVCELVLLDDFNLSEEQIFRYLWSNIDSCSEFGEYRRIRQDFSTHCTNAHSQYCN